MTSFMKLIGACSVALVGIGSPAYAVTGNLLANGDFETVGGPATTIYKDVNGNNPLHTLGNWAVYKDIPGWSAFQDGTVVPGKGIEIQRNGTLSVIDSMDAFAGGAGDHYVELESHHNPAGSNNSGMFQTLSLDAGKYEFSFYYSPRTGTLGDNVIHWDVFEDFDPNDGLVGTILKSGMVSGPVNPDIPRKKWTLVETMFELTAASDVSFRMYAGGTDNTLGGFIDNAKVSAIPLPGPVLFVITAFGLAGAVRRFSGTAA